ncbi:MAG: hypothetical protein K2X36_02595, partial [Microbacteriaceae bacterium]|nr:hypothetical protein [Microbacteriaceae bacterium]
MSSLDDLANDLQRLRAEAGGVSYSELATRITRNRESRNMVPAAARTPRSSVYDVFRLGRKRVSVELVEEIVRALDCDDDSTTRWRARAIAANAASADSLVRTSFRPAERAIVVVLCVAAVGVNLIANFTVSSLNLLLYLDMLGTAVASFAFGPWVGAAVGISTTLANNAMKADFTEWGFSLVQIVGAVLWGYGLRAWFGRGRIAFFALNVVVAVACSLVAVTVILVLLDGVSTLESAAELAGSAQALGTSLAASVLSVNMLTSLADKLISGYLALVIVWLLGHYRLGVHPELHMTTERLLPQFITRGFPLRTEQRRQHADVRVVAKPGAVSSTIASDERGEAGPTSRG